MNRIFLIDGHSQIFRMYYAFMRRPMINSKGVDTSILYGFTKMILEIISKEHPSHIAVAFDPPAKTFRHDAYEEYKANRSAAPELVKAALEPLQEILKALNIPVVMMPGYEADDVIGSMATQWDNSDNEIFMVTPDKDYGQLISANVMQYKLGKGEEPQVVGPKEVCEQYSIENPKQVIDILTICGDASDNVPGIKGIGEVGAKKLIAQFGSVDNIVEHRDELSPKQRTAVEQSLDHLQMSKFLVTIKTDIDLPVSLDSIKYRYPDYDKLNEIIADYEFNSLRKFVDMGGKDGGSNEKKETAAFTEPDLFSSFGSAESSSGVKEPVSVVNVAEVSYRELAMVAAAEGEVALRIYDSVLYLGISGKYTKVQQYKDAEYLLADDKIAKTGYNIKDYIKTLRDNGMELCGRLYDIELMHYVLQPERAHKEEILFKTYLNTDIEPLAEGERQHISVSLLVELRKQLAAELEKTGQTKLYTDIEAPLIPVLADMEYTGVKIDTEHLLRYSKELTYELLKIEDDARMIADDMFLNLSSPKQVAQLLYEKLKLNPKAKKSSTGHYSTDEKTLTELEGSHPIVNMILEYRGLKKLISSYTDNIPLLISPKDGKVHTTFNQALTATGRLSSTNPNLQNIPVRTSRGKEIRKAFVSQFSEGKILSADYSQIELRLMAHMSNDPHLVDAFNKGKDIHTATAAKVFGVPEEEVTREQRSRAKVANFGIIYGISSFGLSQRLGMSRTASKELIEEYFRNYPKVKEYMDNMIEKGRKDGFVETIYGRKRFLPDINSRNATVRGYNERNAINAPLQGSAADIIKVAMINVYRCMKQMNLKSKMILQVHDELVFDVVPNEIEQLKELVTKQMESVIKLRVPLVAEAGVGNNWLEAH